MPSAPSNEWLEAGIAAVKSGDKKTAHQLLLKAIETDERSDQAWLWLSAVVESDEERRICLENVLAIDPDSQLAKKGLASLGQSSSDPPDQRPMTAAIRKHSGSTLPAAEHYADPGQQAYSKFEAAAAPEDLQSRTFNDVWSTEEDICAYCAARVQEADQKCPQCGRSLIIQEYRYAATASLHVYWVFLFTLGLIMVFQALYQLRIEQRMLTAVMHVALAGALIVLVFGIYFRLLWAHLASISVLILALILSGANLLTSFDPGVLGLDAADPAFRGLATTFVARLGSVLKIVQVAIAGLSLFSAIFIVAPEFDRVKERAIARTTTGLHNAVDYHMVARRLMQEGKWASAVLHWQRAAALDRTRVEYQRYLAKAYIRLGFVERSVSVLQSARTLPMQDSIRSEIDRLLDGVQRQLARQKTRA